MKPTERRRGILGLSRTTRVVLLALLGGYLLLDASARANPVGAAVPASSAVVTGQEVAPEAQAVEGEADVGAAEQKGGEEPSASDLFSAVETVPIHGAI